MAKIVVGEILAKIRWQIKTTDANGAQAACDLTGCTAQAKYRINGGTLKTKNIDVVAPATSGIVELQSVADCWDVAGIAEGRIYITSGSLVGMSWRWKLEVEDV